MYIKESKSLPFVGKMVLNDTTKALWSFWSSGCICSNVWFALDENCWVCKKWLLHSTVAGLTSPPFLFQDQNGEVTVECSIHFLHTQQFLSSANRTLTVTSEKGGREINGIWCAIFLLRKQVHSQRGLCSLAIMSHGRPLPGNSGHFCSEMDIVGANC